MSYIPHLQTQMCPSCPYLDNIYTEATGYDQEELRSQNISDDVSWIKPYYEGSGYCCAVSYAPR